MGNLKGLTDVTGKKGFGSESSSAVPVALRDGFALKVLPSHVILTKLNTDYFSMGQCSPILVSATVPFIISPILHNSYMYEVASLCYLSVSLTLTPSLPHLRLHLM